MRTKLELQTNAKRYDDGLATARALYDFFAKDPDFDTSSNLIEKAAFVADVLLEMGRSQDAQREVTEAGNQQIVRTRNGVGAAWGSYASAARQVARSLLTVGDAEAAWQTVRSAYDTLLSKGEANRSQLLTTEDLLVWCSILSGRAAEAEAMARELVDATGGDWKISSTLRLADVLLLTGRSQEAIPLYTEASEGWSQSDNAAKPTYRADDVLSDLKYFESHDISRPEFAEIRGIAEAALERAKADFTASHPNPPKP